MNNKALTCPKSWMGQGYFFQFIKAMVEKTYKTILWKKQINRKHITTECYFVALKTKISYGIHIPIIQQKCLIFELKVV